MHVLSNCKSHTMDEVLLAGNNLAMLVAVSELARRGRRVRLCSDAKPLGGHFAGMRLQGQGYDIGMVMLEQVRSATPDDDLRHYRSNVRNDWTRFGHLAWRWLEQQGALQRVPTPECQVGGRIGPDYLIANRLDLLSGLGLPGPDSLPAGDPRHPSHKTEPGPYDSLSYAQAAQRCHGHSFHAQAIEPFVRKLMGVGSDGFLARYHRAAWAPLFYPDTLRAALAGQPTGLQEYPFWTTPSGFVGQLVADLQARLQAHPCVVLDHDPLLGMQADGSGLRLHTAGGSHTGRAGAALGLTAERCRALLDLPPQAAQPAASVVVAFFQVRVSSIGRPTGCLMVVDDDHASYRLSDQDALAGRDAEYHRVTVEASPERLAALYPGQTAEAALAQELRALMQVGDPAGVQVLKCITARNAISLPTQAAIDAAEQARQALALALPGVWLTGNLLGYGVASFNDQIVQGLQLAEAMS
jgi:hypothetical protein